MKDFESRLTSNHKAFLNYNRYKQNIMHENDPEGARVFLQLLPLCLHVNHPLLPGFIPDINCPCGIKTMEWPSDTIKTLGTCLSIRIDSKELKEHVPKKREIEGVFTIGSVASVGQTDQSDYDIWVVVERDSISKSRMKILRNKLELINKWMTTQYKVDGHFFLMDILDIRANNFGKVSHEGSGSAQKILLKEEFYRTMTHIEGRIPLWWILPVGISAQGYAQGISLLDQSRGSGADDFVDMGNIDKIPEQEFLGAALWQMHKALDDPLKSVIKMALVATYLEPDGDEPLLCEILKDKVLHATNDDVVDPYIETFRRIERYYTSQGDSESIELLRKCFYLKVAPNITKKDLMRIGGRDKASIMIDVVKSWGWSLKVITDLNRFHEWDVERYRAFGDEMHQYLKRTTILLIRRAKAFVMKDSMREDRELEILRRRIEAFYVSKDGKIRCEKRVKQEEPAYHELYFSFTDGIWHIHNISPVLGKRVPIMSDERIVRILAWLVYNRRVDPATVFHMIPNSTNVLMSHIQSLLSHLSRLIPEANSIGLEREALIEKSYIEKIILIGNMELPGTLNSVKEVDVIYLNSWHELFCRKIDLKRLKSWISKVKRADTKINMWLPSESDSKRLAKSFVSLIS